MVDHRDRAELTPIQLAEEVMKVVGDAPSGTARTALEIARLLILHRDDAAVEFELECSTNESCR